jgi:hypothetical protein
MAGKTKYGRIGDKTLFNIAILPTGTDFVLHIAG